MGAPASVRRPPAGVRVRIGAALGRFAAACRRDVARDLADNRGFLWWPVAAGVGAALYFVFPVEPDGAAVAVAAGLALVAAWTVRRGGPGAFAVALAVAAVLGFSAGKAETLLAGAPRLSGQRTYALAGTVLSVEDRAGRGYRVVLRPVRMEPMPREGMPRRLRIAVRGAGTTPRPGDGLSLKARLGPPSGPLVPGGYDFARVAYFAGIGGVGFSMGAPEATAAGGSVDGTTAAIIAVEGFRQTISQRIRAVLPGGTGAIAAALVVGDRGAIPPQTDRAMRVSGLSHILSISGLHMALVAACLFGGIRALIALVPALALRLPAKKIAAAAALAGTLAYLVVAGFGVPTERSAIMIGVALTAVLLDRRALSLRTVAVAALFVLALRPDAVLDPGAQMSFAAVVALIAGYEALAARLKDPAPPDISRVFRAAAALRRWVGLSMLTSLIAGLATAPVALHHFSRLAPLGLLANLAATPLVTFVIMPAAVAAAFALPLGLERWPLLAMGAGIDGMTAIAGTVAAWTPGGGAFGRPALAATLAAAAGGIWLALWRGRVRLLGLAPLVFALVVGRSGVAVDLIVAGDGRGALIAREDGRFALIGRPDNFEAGLWLATLGDARSPDDGALAAGTACDRDACILAGADGRARAAVVFRPIAFGDECAGADLVITGLAAPPWCRAETTVIDAADLAGAGARSYRLAAGDKGLALLPVDRAVPATRRPWSGG